MKQLHSLLLTFDAVIAFDVLRCISAFQDWNSVVIQMQPSAQFFKSQRITERWVKGEISTFKCLILLNQSSSRSFNDPRMYPIFPWVVSDHQPDVLDSNNPSTFCDFTKPMASLDDK
jgi:hypothetical protein